MDRCNILITTSGRRVELLKCFRRAAAKVGVYSNIITADMADMAPTAFFADGSYIVPSVTSPSYISAVIDICNKENISLIIPTIDTGLYELALGKSEIESKTGAIVMVSSPDFVKMSSDKRLTHEFLDSLDFGSAKLISPLDVESGNITFPLFIKPSNGSSSVNAFRVNNMRELDFFREYIKDPIIEEYLPGDEYTVDAFCDFEGNPLSVAVRRRIAVRGGEILKGAVVENEAVRDDALLFLRLTKPVGQITLQCKLCGGIVRYIEINPRFGGGAPMSIAAGADSCEKLYRLLRGETLNFDDSFKKNLFFSRFDSSVCFDSDGNLLSLNSGIDCD